MASVWVQIVTQFMMGSVEKKLTMLPNPFYAKFSGCALWPDEN